MAAGTIVPGTPRQDGVNAYVSVVVAEGGALGNVEYSGQTPLVDAAGNAKSNAQVKADLVAACKAARDAQLRASAQAMAGVTGAVVL